MSDEEHVGDLRKMGFENVQDGYTILMGEDKISEFMDSHNLHSTEYLEYFDEIGTHLDQRVSGSGGISLIALSVSGDRKPRDFSALHIAHKLARSDKKVLIVDCDFLDPGLSGMVEDVEDYGFLDLLLYGSSLKSISREIGIEGVSVTGSGSFPVSRTVPFALKEFDRTRSFLMESYDVVIFCTTLYTEDKKVNPLIEYTEEVILCCRIEKMEQGELQKDLSALGPDAPLTNLLCFCREKEGGGIKEIVSGRRGGQKEGISKRGEEEIEPSDEALEMRDSGKGVGKDEHEEEERPAYIEKTDEIEDMGKGEIERRSRAPSLIIIGVAAVIVVFLVWWLMMDRTISNREPDKETTEQVQMERQAREAVGEGINEEEVKEVETGKEQQEAGVEEVSAVLPEQPQEEQEETEGQQPHDFFYVHVSSFKELGRARQEMHRYEESGFEVSLVVVEIKGENWYRVAIGKYETFDEAMDAKIDIISRTNAGYSSVKKFGKGKLVE